MDTTNKQPTRTDDLPAQEAISKDARRAAFRDVLERFNDTSPIEEER